MTILNRFSAILRCCDSTFFFASGCGISGDSRPAILGKVGFTIRDSAPLSPDSSSVAIAAAAQDHFRATSLTVQPLFVWISFCSLLRFPFLLAFFSRDLGGYTRIRTLLWRGFPCYFLNQEGLEGQVCRSDIRGVFLVQTFSIFS